MSLTCGDHSASHTGVDADEITRVIAWPFPQITKSVPFGWKASDGMPQEDPGLVLAGNHGPSGVAEWCMKPEPSAVAEGSSFFPFSVSMSARTHEVQPVVGTRVVFWENSFAWPSPLQILARLKAPHPEVFSHAAAAATAQAEILA